MFYNVIDLALINSWIFVRDICKSGVSRQKFAQRVVEELTGTTPGDIAGKNALAQRNPLKINIPPEKKGKTCAISKCPNRTMDLCNTCRRTVCGKCAVKICPNCVD